MLSTSLLTTDVYSQFIPAGLHAAGYQFVNSDGASVWARLLSLACSHLLLPLSLPLLRRLLDARSSEDRLVCSGCPSCTRCPGNLYVTPLTSAMLPETKLRILKSFLAGSRLLLTISIP